MGVDNINLLILNITDEFGGAEKSIVGVMRKLIKNKYININFIINNENKELVSLLKKANINYYTGNFKKISISLKGIYNLVFNIFVLISLIKKIKVDLIISNTSLSHILSFFIYPFFLNKKFIHIIRDFSFRKLYLRLIDKYTSKIIFVSEAEANYYDVENYDIIPNGVDFQNQNSNYNSKYREKYDISNESVLFGMATRFVKWKGIDDTIKGFAKAKNNLLYFDSFLLIAGKKNSNNEYTKKIVNLIKELNLEDNVILIDWIDNIEEFFYDLDVIISSSKTRYNGPETFGRTIIEAWKMKKPVLTTDCGGPKYLVTHESDGLKVEEENIEMISNALIRLYNDSNLRNKLGQNGYKRFLDKYTIDNISQKYIKLINNLTLNSESKKI